MAETSEGKRVHYRVAVIAAVAALFGSVIAGSASFAAVRAQAGSDNSRLLRNDRRTAYVAMLGAAQQYTVAIAEWNGRKDYGSVSPILKAYRALYESEVNAELVAPDSIVKRVRSLRSLVWGLEEKVLAGAKLSANDYTALNAPLDDFLRAAVGRRPVVGAAALVAATAKGVRKRSGACSRRSQASGATSADPAGSARRTRTTCQRPQRQRIVEARQLRPRREGRVPLRQREPMTMLRQNDESGPSRPLHTDRHPTAIGWFESGCGGSVESWGA